MKDYNREKRLVWVRDYRKNKQAQRMERGAWMLFAAIVVCFSLFFLGWILLIK